MITLPGTSSLFSLHSSRCWSWTLPIKFNSNYSDCCVWHVMGEKSIFPSNKNRALLHLKIEWIRYLFFSYFCSDIHNHRQHKEGRMTALKPEWQMNTQWLKKHLRDSYIRNSEENLPKGKGFQPDPNLCKTSEGMVWEKLGTAAVLSLGAFICVGETLKIWG